MRHLLRRRWQRRRRSFPSPGARRIQYPEGKEARRFYVRLSAPGATAALAAPGKPDVSASHGRCFLRLAVAAFDRLAPIRRDEGSIGHGWHSHRVFQALPTRRWRRGLTTGRRTGGLLSLPGIVSAAPPAKGMIYVGVASADAEDAASPPAAPAQIVHIFIVSLTNPGAPAEPRGGRDARSREALSAFFTPLARARARRPRFQPNPRRPSAPPTADRSADGCSRCTGNHCSKPGESDRNARAPAPSRSSKGRAAPPPRARFRCSPASYPYRPARSSRRGRTPAFRSVESLP